MVVKKQLKKISKKILVLGLATSIIFTSCFSTKKIEVHAAAATATLSAWTLYEICLYVGTLAVTTLGIGAVYENRDEIAYFGKTIIDSMTDIPEQGWFFGSSTAQGDSTVYGREALVAAQMAAWAQIVIGGQTPQNNNNNDDDDDEGNDGEGSDGETEVEENYSKRTQELGFINFFLTSAGVQLIGNTIKSVYNSWVNKEDNNVLDYKYGPYDAYYYNGLFPTTDNGLYYGYVTVGSDILYIESQKILGIALLYNEYYDFYEALLVTPSKTTLKVFKNGTLVSGTSNYYDPNMHLNFGLPEDCRLLTSTFPVFDNVTTCRNYLNNLTNTDGLLNGVKSYQVADWIADDDAWKGYLEDISTSLRSLQDLVNIAQQLSENALTTQPSANDYADAMNDLSTEYAPSLDPFTNPNYWPSTNTTPQIDPSLFPNYQPSINPDSGEIPDNPTQGGNGEDDIDLDGLGNLFSILFYLIMIIIMLIYLFLACLSFIVMIFRIPPSSAMLPDEMVMGFDHLKTIMIPGMNISIYGFAMALIYLLIIFTVIKILRLEINDFKFPRAGRKP